MFIGAPTVHWGSNCSLGLRLLTEALTIHWGSDCSLVHWADALAYLQERGNHIIYFSTVIMSCLRVFLAECDVLRLECYKVAMMMMMMISPNDTRLRIC